MQSRRCSTGRLGPRVIALAVLASCAGPSPKTGRRWEAQDGDVLNPGGQGIDYGGAPGGSGGFKSGGAGGFGGGFGNTGGFGGAPAPAAPVDVGSPDPPADPLLPNQPFTATGPPGPCTLSITVTTVTFGSDYSPSNIGALWIADSNGKFIKTLAVWANRRMRYLEEWNQATSAAGLARDTVDATTGATARSHSTHVAKWNCTDSKRAQVARGAYRLCMEMTEYNGPGPKGCIPFDNSGTAFRLTPPDIGSYKARVLDYKPQ